jgi:hypothetical protein
MAGPGPAASELTSWLGRPAKGIAGVGNLQIWIQDQVVRI